MIQGESTIHDSAEIWNLPILFTVAAGTYADGSSTSRATSWLSFSPNGKIDLTKKTPKTRTRVDVGYILGRSFVGRVLECGWDVRNQERRVGGVMDVHKVIITLFNHSNEESVDLNFSGIHRRRSSQSPPRLPPLENHPARPRPRKPRMDRLPHSITTQHEHPIHTHPRGARTPP